VRAIRRGGLLILALLLVALLAQTASAAPEGAVQAAGEGLIHFKEMESGHAGYWGLTEEELQSLSLTGGYQMVGFNGPEDAPIMVRVAPYGRDHYLFFLTLEGRNVLEMRVVDMPDGWQAVSFGAVRAESAGSLAEARRLLRSRNLAEDTEPRVFLFRGHALWLIDAGGQTFVYPMAGRRVAPELQKAGVTADDLVPAEPVLRRLAGADARAWWTVALILLPVIAALAAVSVRLRREHRRRGAAA